MSSEKPSITIGVVTHERAQSFGKLLTHIAPIIGEYPGQCEVVVANNSGVPARSVTEKVVDDSGIRTHCPCRIFDSPKNNIAVGRNIVLDNASLDYIAFIDDDEQPCKEWLHVLVSAIKKFDCIVVAGPIVSVFEKGAKKWIRQTDLHNIGALKTGDPIIFPAAGNFLIDRIALGHHRFDPAYGISGGEDTEFFLRLGDHGHNLIWCEDALVHEDIPLNKSTAKYMLRRYVSQGANYARIRRSRGDIKFQSLFVIRAMIISAGSGVVAMALISVGHKRAGNWIKRAFTNLGKFYAPRKQLYG